MSNKSFCCFSSAATLTRLLRLTDAAEGDDEEAAAASPLVDFDLAQVKSGAAAAAAARAVVVPAAAEVTGVAAVG